MYIGPYVVCDVELVIIEEKHRTCSSKSCKFFELIRIGQFFCSFCGSKIEDRLIKKTKEKINKNEVYELLNEKMYYKYVHLKSDTNAKQHFWFSNKSEVNDLLKTQEKYITYELRKKEKNAFKTFHKKEINILNNLYGKDKVKICWGILKETRTLPCRVDEMSEKEHAIFDMATELYGALKFAKDNLKPFVKIEE